MRTSIRFDFPDALPPAPTPRGGAAVGLLHELPALELTAILCLRAWCDGGPRRAKLDRDLHTVLDPSDVSIASGDLDALMGTVVAAARRPLMRHAFGCQCFGGDESAFANLIAAAAGRDREEAMLFASLLMNRMRRPRPIEISLADGIFVRPAEVSGVVSAHKELTGDSRMSSL